MTDTWAHLRALAKSHVDPGEILTHMNRLLTGDQQEEFISMFYCRIDPTSRSVTYASAGHAGYLIKKTGEAQILSATGMVLNSWSDDTILTAPDVNLNDEDVLLVPTDGILESRDSKNGIFGLERTLDVVREHRSQSANSIVRTLKDTAQSFTGDREQEDDITLVVIKIKES